jgi:hypothetical protein
MTIFQVVSALFALFMVYVITIHYKRKNLNKLEAWAWYATWGLFIFIALFPHLLLGITGLLRFARVFDLLIVIAFMILSVVVFMSYFKIKSLERKLETFVRAKALRDITTKETR